MTDFKTLDHQTDTPVDVAALFSWANLRGATYKDFSASRAQARDKTRQCAKDAVEEERSHTHKQAEAERGAEAQLAAEVARLAELSAQARASQAELTEQQASLQRDRQLPRPDGFSALAASNLAPAATLSDSPQPKLPVRRAEEPAYAPREPYRSAPTQPQYAPPRADSYVEPRNPREWPESGETPVRPARLESGRPVHAASPVRQMSEDTPDDSRRRLTSPGFALKDAFGGSSVNLKVVSALMPSHAPVLAVFSIAGGVGKTSLVATLGRALSGHGERVLLVETTECGSLPFFFGARDQRPNVLRTFSPQGASDDAPIQMVTIDCENLDPDMASHNSLSGEIARSSRNKTSRVIVDLATASGITVRRILRMSPMFLVPVVPDLNSEVSVDSIDAFFQRNGSAAGDHGLPYYVLNQFDPAVPLHLDVREVLRERLGSRLLPFELRRAPAVSEALAEEMTVMDYAPDSNLAEDFGKLADWVKSHSVPAITNYRELRWSER
jgi:cellulose synthase operon protein YhjQ